MRILGVPMGGKKALEVVSMLDTVCLQPKVWNNLKKLVIDANYKRYLLEHRHQHSTVFSRCAKW